MAELQFVYTHVHLFRFSFEILPGTAAEYKRRHDKIWPELVAELEAAGPSNYSLFRLGDDRVVAYVECEPGAAASFGALAHAEANLRWSAWFEDVIVSLTDEDGNLHASERSGTATNTASAKVLRRRP